VMRVLAICGCRSASWGSWRLRTASLSCLIAMLAAHDAAAAGPPCPRQVDDAAEAPALKAPIALMPAAGSAQRLENLGTSRSLKVVQRVTIAADMPLPDSLMPDQLNFDALLSRVGDTLESTDFPTPTFSQPRISSDRRNIIFDICLNPGSIPPGKYTGSVTIGGPPGLSAATLSLTVNAKTSTSFWFGATLSLIAALLLLILKDAAAFRTASNPQPSWWKAFLHPISDPPWLATTVVALGTAFGTLYAVYANNPAWGSGGFSDIAALIGAGFAAVGGHAILTTLTPTPSP
jgi:hypothetical protein